MMRHLITAFLFCITLVACGDDSQSENTDEQNVSFKAITNAWFAQAPEDIPPSPTDVSFDYDANDDPDAFTALLESHIDVSTP